MIEKQKLSQRLRDAAARLRRTPMPLKDLIPLLQEAADKVEILEPMTLEDYLSDKHA